MRFLSILVLPSLGSAALNCRPEGPVLPKPSLHSLSSSPILSAAAAGLASELDAAIAGSISAGWETSNVSFSLALVTADQEEPGVPLWEYHHLAEANTRGTTELDRDSQYLIGSISKLVSDYIMLQSGVDVDAPITKYLPKLEEPGSIIRWEDVSLRILATHLSGAPVNYGFSEYYYLKDIFLSFGLPPFNDSAYPPCGVITLNGGCNPDDFLSGMRNSYPITAVNERPAYSTVSFTIIFMAIENITGKNYTQLVNKLFAQPLELLNTFPSPGDEEKAVIPLGENTWGTDYGVNAPGDGLISSLSDLTKFSHSILSRSILLTKTELRGWMKPSSFAGSPYTFVGMPWEIYRPVDLTPEHPHPVAIFGKSGGAMGYRSQVSLVDEYGIGIVALSAGPMQALPLLSSAMLSTFVPAVDEMTRTLAEKSYARTFKSARSKRDSHTNSTTIFASFAQDDDSLVLTALTRGDDDILTGLVELWDLTVGQFIFPFTTPVRVFPGDLDEQTNLHDGTKVTRETWRLWPAFNMTSDSELPGKTYDANNCVTWMIGDWVHYGREPTDRVLFYRNKGGGHYRLGDPLLALWNIATELSSPLQNNRILY